MSDWMAGVGGALEQVGKSQQFYTNDDRKKELEELKVMLAQVADNTKRRGQDVTAAGQRSRAAVSVRGLRSKDANSWLAPDNPTDWAAEYDRLYNDPASAANEAAAAASGAAPAPPAAPVVPAASGAAPAPA